MNFQKLDEFLEKETNNLKIPGASCMVYHNGKTVYVKSTGYADIDAQKRMSQHTCLNLYSLTKVITCIAALQLYERGEYLLGEPLHKYMPEFSDMSVIKNINGREEIVPCTKEITIKNLFTMTAGFGGNFDSPAIHRTKQKNGGTVELNEFIKEFSEEPLEFEPGEKWKYGLCHDVLAALIEVISDMKFSEYLKKNIFEPLEISDIGFNLEDFESDKLGSLYSYNSETKAVSKVKNDNFCKFGIGYESGGGGIISSASEYLKIAIALANNGVGLNGVRILGKHTIDLMKTNHLNESCLKSFDWPELAGYGYGLGVRTMMDVTKAGSNASVGEFGWNGAGGSYMLADTKENLAVVYTEHVLNGALAGGRIHTKLKNVVYSCINEVSYGR